MSTSASDSPRKSLVESSPRFCSGRIARLRGVNDSSFPARTWTSFGHDDHCEENRKSDRGEKDQSDDSILLRLRMRQLWKLRWLGWLIRRQSSIRHSRA